LAVAAVAFGGTVALAQENAEQPADEDEVIEELVVFANKKSGDPVDVDALYEEMMRERLMLEQDSLTVSSCMSARSSSLCNRRSS